MDTLRLAILASSTTAKQNLTLKNAVSLAISCSDDVWSLVEPSQANLLLIWVNSDKDSNVLLGLQEKYPPERLIVLASHEYSIKAPWHLSFTKQQTIPAILSIANLLSRVQAHFLPNYPLETPRYFDANAYLVGIIEQSVSENMACICSYPSCPEVYLLPKENSFYLNGPMEALIPMFLADRHDIHVVEVSDKQVLETVSYVKFSSRLSSYLTLDEDSVFEDIAVKKYKRYSINELIWLAMLVCSRGRLVNGTSLTDTVLLKQLPEYLRLELYNKEYKALADCMNTRVKTLPEIGSATAYSLPEIIGFFNACHQLKLIERGDAAKQLIDKNHQAYETIKNIFTPVGIALRGRIKIVIAGSIGSGKTTAISTLSHFTPISTETRPSDNVTKKKSTTTVAMDYGEMRFNDELKIFLYGTPGQKRFDFMSQILCDNAWGMLLLIDNTETDPLAELDYYLNLFEKFLPKIQLVVGITHTDMAEKPTCKDYSEHLKCRHLDFPVLAVDARDIASLAGLMGKLVTNKIPLSGVSKSSVAEGSASST